jgi:hypothetical protein
MIVAPRLTQKLQQRRIYVRALLFICLLLASSLIISLLSLSAQAQTQSSTTEGVTLETSRRSFCQLREFRLLNSSSIGSAVKAIAALDTRGEARFLRRIPELCPGARTQHEAQLLTFLRASLVSANLNEDMGVRNLLDILGTQGLKEITPSALATQLILAVAELRQWEKSPRELAQLRRNPAQFEQLMRDASPMAESTAAQRDRLINGDRGSLTESSAQSSSTLPGLAGSTRQPVLPGRSDQEMHRSRELGARLNAGPSALRREVCEQAKQAGRLPSETDCE